MEEIEKEKIRVQRNILKKKEIVFVEGDAIIPDTKPDFIKCISANGIATIYKKEITNEKLKVDGNVIVYLMYFTDDKKGNIRGINTTLDFSKLIDCKNCADNINTDVSVNVKNVECKFINERKIKIEVTLDLEVKSYEFEEIEIITEIDDKNNLQALQEERNITTLIGNGDTRIVGKDTILLDVADELVEILNANLSIINKDVKISYNKVLTKAECEFKLIYLTEDNRINTKNIKIPIIGFIDMPNVNEGQICNINYEIKNILIKLNSQEEHSIYIEIETKANCQVYENKKSKIIQDLYSPELDLKMSKRELRIISNKMQICEKNKIVEEVNMENIKNCKLIDVITNYNIINQKIEKGSFKCEGELNLKFMLQENVTAEITIKECKIPFKFITNISEQKISMDVDTSIEIGMTNYIIQDDTIKCDVDFMAVANIEQNASLNIIEEVEFLENKKSDDYSMIIYILKQGDTLWNIAKRFGSTVNDIKEINNIEDINQTNIGEKIYIPKYIKQKIVSNA